MTITAPTSDSDAGRQAFVRANTELAAAPLLPEILLHLATQVTPLWEATEANLAACNLPPPYWAFAWPGGRAVARHLLDNPGLVAGRRVLDFASGSGMAAIAAAKAGAARVAAVEIDDFAVAAIGLNAGANGVTLDVLRDDIVGRPLPGIDVILAGDVCYERPMAERVIAWLRGLARGGTLVILGDPGRAYLPKSGLEALARFAVPTSLDLEDREVRDTTVWRLLGEG
ncbi:50S ribosomal protein L11 methyltransferase [Skermanella rosea]|uniref:class I SAM-dependent methyltransferase n=1 Tax=Skermanella rosea TaxID=1817965 RepID=UPI001932A2CD|nr:50S ribosomal protein L11 methyltransferase [Skermanella rosea]UEM04340.1 50S ribosomal protein L11 methyltransferase [Skermanella rosea]